jgi:hypothetical protein
VIAQLVIARQAFGDTGQLLIVSLSAIEFALALVSVIRVHTAGSETTRATVGD